MKKSTLDEFINRVRNTSGQGNEWVIEQKFESLYVRYGRRYVHDYNQLGFHYHDVLDLANITVEEEYRGTGVFTRLIDRLRKTYPGLHIFVEIVNPTFVPLLSRLGFKAVPYNSFFLEGEEIVEAMSEIRS